MNPQNLVITILTGRRPHLLERTLKSAEAAIGEVLEGAWKFMLINGGDWETQVVARDNETWHHFWAISQVWSPIGLATTRCAFEAQWLARQKDLHAPKYWLHLEDDWECVEAPEGWLEESCALLDSGKVDQVRLRRDDEPVLKRHMVTGKAIQWKREGNFKIGEAHLTFNPALMRTEDIPDAFPCQGEREAQRKWLAAGRKASAQHVPGLWQHIGAGESLRGRQT